MHLAMLVVSLGSSIIFTGVYPYLYSLDPNVLMIEYGIVVAADAAAQMIFAPLFGILIDRIKTVRPVVLICCTLFFLGNILYSLVGLFNRDNFFGAPLAKTRVWVMLFSRFVVGAGTALNSAGRYYVSSATLISERTTHISLLSLFQTLGFIIGPGIQAALTPIGPGDPMLEDGDFRFNMYTSTGYVSALTGVLCFTLFLPCIFKECYIAIKELEAIKKMASKEESKTTAREIVRRISRIHTPEFKLEPIDEEKEVEQAGEQAVKTQYLEPKRNKVLREFTRVSLVEAPIIRDPELDFVAKEKKESGDEEKKYPPMLPIIVSIYNYFAFLANFVLLETILTKLAMDQWGWSSEDAIARMGYVIMGAGAMSAFVFAGIGPLAKRFDERMLLIVLGIIPMILGRVVMFPIPGRPNPPLKQSVDCLDGQIIVNGTVCVYPESTTTALPYDGALDWVARAVVGTEEVGCSYEWCAHIPRIEVAQFMVGFVLATAGYPFCLSLSGSLYSKVIGSINPGFWLGLFATSGSIARVVGPLVVTEIYELWGTYALFIGVTATLVISFFLTILAYKSMVPESSVEKAENKDDKSKKSKVEENGKVAKSPDKLKLPEVVEENEEEEENNEKPEKDDKEDRDVDNKNSDNASPTSFKKLVVYDD